MSEGMTFSEVGVEDLGQHTPGSVEINRGTSPSQDIDSALGIDDARPQVVEAPKPPAVNEFLNIVDGKTDKGAEPAPSSSETQQLIQALTTQNKEMASALGRQGQEVVGPQRAEIENLQRQIAELKGAQQNAPGRQAEMLEQTAKNLFPTEDPTDEFVQKHASAHIKAADMVGATLKEQIVAPLMEEIASLKAQVQGNSMTNMVGNIPAETVASLQREHPMLADTSIPVEQRVAMIRGLASKGSGGTTRSSIPSPYGGAATHVEGTMSSGQGRGYSEAAVEKFESMSSEEMGMALGSSLARKGAESLGY